MSPPHQVFFGIDQPNPASAPESSSDPRKITRNLCGPSRNFQAGDHVDVAAWPEAQLDRLDGSHPVEQDHAAAASGCWARCHQQASIAWA
jgi:hypothetical protein